MKKFLLKNRINFLFLFISFLCLICILGIENISFKSVKWLYNGNDTATHQLGWYFFRNDIWRFPLGSNPNYGGELASSIVFSDSMPILALFFKSLKSFIPENFQYFSFWYFICFYLQLFFSFKILKKFTNSDLYSLVGSIFFLISPIFIYRLYWHSALAGQWILLFTLYLGLTQKINKSKLPWIFLIILSSLIHFYLTVMVLTVYSVLRIFNFYFEKENFFKVTKDFLVIATLLLLTLYIIVFFEIRMVDSLSVGFGVYKLNLLSFFDSGNGYQGVFWSWFLPDIKLTEGEEIEGFNYFGLGQIAMFLFVFILFLNKNYKKNFSFIKENREIKTFFLISLLLTFWALSNNISIGSNTLEIPLNKYIFGALSIIKSTGRMFWIVNYFLLILSLVIIYKCFKEKNSFLIIFLFLTIQITDISAGLKNYILPLRPSNENAQLKDQIWDDLLKRYKVVKTTFPINWSGHFSSFSYFFEKYNIEKTNLAVLARTRRKAAAEARYHLYSDFRKKNLEPNTVYIIHGLGHLRHLKHLFKNENVGFFYRDNIWSMVMNEKERMNDNDKKIFNEIEPQLLKINEKKNLYFNDENNYYGFGWSHNFTKPGIWSEGQMSTLFFRTEKNYGDLKLEIFYRPYLAKENHILEFEIYVNDSFNKNIKLKLAKNNFPEDKIEIFINQRLIIDNKIKIDFNFKNLISPFDKLESPDSRKLGILVKNIRIISI